MKSWLNKFMKMLWIVIAASLLSESVYAYKIRIIHPADASTVASLVSISASICVNVCDKNKNYYEIDQFIRSKEREVASVFNDLSIEDALNIFKAILYNESGWIQFDDNGNINTNYNSNESSDYGISQINSKDAPLDMEKWAIEKIKSDEEYNIKAGIQSLKNKKVEIDYMQRKEKLKWAKLIKVFNLSKRPQNEIILKAYNGWSRKTAWNYPNTIKNIANKKPWQKQVEVRMLVDSRVIAQSTIRLIDLFSCSWDTLKEKNGSHKLTASAVKSSHKINVTVDNEKKKEETEVEASGVVWGQMTGTVRHEMNGIKADFNITIQEIKYQTPEEQLDDEKAIMLANFNPKTEEERQKMSKTIDSMQREQRQYLKDYKPKKKYFDGKCVAEFRLQQLSAGRGVMRFTNPYVIETAIDGCIDEEKVEELKGGDPFAGLPPEVRAKLPPARNLSMPSGGRQSQAAKGDMRVELGLHERKDGKDIKYYSRQKYDEREVFVGGNLEQKKASEASANAQVSEESESYLSIGKILSGLTFEGHTSQKDKNKIVLTEDSITPVSFGSLQGNISIKAKGYLKTKK